MPVASCVSVCVCDSLIGHFQGQAVYMYSAEEAWREAMVMDVDLAKDVVTVKVEDTDQVGHWGTWACPLYSFVADIDK